MISSARSSSFHAGLVAALAAGAPTERGAVAALALAAVARARVRSALAALAVAAVACGGAEPPGAEAPPVGTRDAASSSELVCTQTFQRQRECTDEFIPALVALRVAHDEPAGIAAADQAQGRDALVAQAKEEWKVDSTDAAIARTCQAMVASLAADGRAAFASQARRCLAKTACAAFVDCLSPTLERHLR